MSSAAHRGHRRSMLAAWRAAACAAACVMPRSARKQHRRRWRGAAAAARRRRSGLISAEHEERLISTALKWLHQLGVLGGAVKASRRPLSACLPRRRRAARGAFFALAARPRARGNEPVSTSAGREMSAAAAIRARWPVGVGISCQRGDDPSRIYRPSRPRPAFSWRRIDNGGIISARGAQPLLFGRPRVCVYHAAARAYIFLQLCGVARSTPRSSL